MKYPLFGKPFASQLEVGDMINGHSDGWLTIEKIYKHNLTSFQNIEVVFTNGMRKTYSDGDRVGAIRRYNDDFRWWKNEKSL